MSDLNLDNIVGFKAVDKDGNEQNVTVDEMVDMVSTRMVMALSETSTFAAVAATGNDVYENELPTVTDAANVRVLQSSGDAAQMTMQSLASKLGGLTPFTSFLRPEKLYINYNTNSGNIPLLVGKGVYLIVVYDINDPTSTCFVGFYNSNTPGEFVPSVNMIINNGGISIGWKSTLQFTKTEIVVNIATYKLG